MSTPEMYPLTDSPTYTEQFDTFAELRAAFEALSDGLNFPVSWFIFDPESEDWDGSYLEFSLCIFMPRKSKTTTWTTHGVFDRAEVQTWLDSYVKGRVLEWYGWAA